MEMENPLKDFDLEENLTIFAGQAQFQFQNLLPTCPAWQVNPKTCLSRNSQSWCKLSK